MRVGALKSKKYPLLTEIGSKRKDTQLYGWKSKRLEGKPYAPGFYTQEQIREIVAYAAERFIMVVPEVDMPAHFAAAIAAYPYLACRENPQARCIGSTGAPSRKKRWAGRIGTAPPAQARRAPTNSSSMFWMKFCPSFPPPISTLAAMKRRRTSGKTCPHCQKGHQKAHGLKDVEELQGLFNNRIAAHLKEKGQTANRMERSAPGRKSRQIRHRPVLDAAARQICGKNTSMRAAK